MTAINEMEKHGIKGGIYHYKNKECSCCYGLKNVDFEINDNIPENWGVYDSNDIRDAYHKIIYSLSLNKVQLLVKVLRKVLKKSGWKVCWKGDVNSAILLRQPKAI